MREEHLQTQTTEVSGPVKPLGPFKQWALDDVVPMPETKQCKRFLITAIDYSTRWPVAWADSKHTTQDFSSFIGLEIISCFGNPKRLIEDGGREMVFHLLDAYCARNYVEHIITAPYHPQANGRVERLKGSVATVH